MPMSRTLLTSLLQYLSTEPNCSLQGRKEAEWGSKVTLLFGDMRFIDVPEQADILISELLGSFGDNELSPECLDGAMRFLKRKHTCTVQPFDVSFPDQLMEYPFHLHIPRI